MLNTNFSPWPEFTNEEIEAVKNVLLSNKVNYWTGDIGRNFEQEFATFSGAKHAIAVSNGTVALDLICNGLKIGRNNGGYHDDEVIVTSRTFLASVSSIVNAGAKPVFVDVERDSQNINSMCIAKAITENTKAVLCVHLAGLPCDMDAIQMVIGDRNIKIIEDCAQAHGASYKGIPVGSLGDAAAWSFCQDKIMTTGGEGGMVTCNDEVLWRSMWAYKDHGKSYQAVYERNHAPGFRWLHEGFGTNWRLTELQSAIGRIQLKRMPQWNIIRTENAQSLIKTLKHYSEEDGLIRLPKLNCYDLKNSDGVFYKHAWYKLYAFVRPENLPSGWNRDRLVNEFNALGLPCYQGSCSEVYLEKAFSNTPYVPPTRLPVAKELGETSLMFLVHPTLTIDNIVFSKKIINQVLTSVRS